MTVEKRFRLQIFYKKTLHRPAALAVTQRKQKCVQPQLAANIPPKPVFQAIQPLGGPRDPLEIYFPAECFQFTA
jgi:hypothetical protein